MKNTYDKIFVDENLPRRVAKALVGFFSESTHVGEKNLLKASDGEVWDFARKTSTAFLLKIGTLNL